MQKIQIVPAIETSNGKILSQNTLFNHKLNKDIKHLNPIEVAKKYEKIGFSEIYVSDLDGILNDNPDFELLKNIANKTSLSVMADIGVWSPEDVARLTNIKPVISSESFTSLNLLEFPKDFVLALITRDEKFLCGIDVSLNEFLDLVRDSSRIKEVLVVDLNCATKNSGPNLRLCKKVIEEMPEKTVLCGGGIRHISDIKALCDVGVKKAVVESALQTGELLKEIYAGFIKI